MKANLSKRLMLLSLSITLLLSLTGCLYNKDQSSGRASARESILVIQDAVDRYKEQTGVLPIQNANADVPLYEKYKIDFGKLQRMNFISQIPAAAFESGGTFQFLVINEETQPQVKLLDLVAFQAVAGLQTKVDQYRARNNNTNPTKDEIYPGFSTIDFKMLGTSEPDILSVYSNQTLNLLLDSEGKVYLDYGIDLATAVQKSGVTPEPNQDLRALLTEQSYYVPVRSPAYHWVNQEPMAIQ